MNDAKPMNIDVEAVLRQRLPKLSRIIPKPLIAWVKRIICQDRLNEVLHANEGKEGADFARGVLKSFGITISARNAHRLPPPDHRRVLYVSNHPLGGLDGMALIDYVQRRHGGKVYFVVNDLLNAVEPLRSVFLPINKHGKQSREAIRAIDRAFDEDVPVIMFPAGLVSRLQRTPFKGRNRWMVKDLEWQKMFVNKARAARRDVIPVHLSGRNSLKFYRAANLRRKLGVGFNFEMILLPREMVRMEGAHLQIAFGDTIPWQSLTPGAAANALAQKIKQSVYDITYV